MTLPNSEGYTEKYSKLSRFTLNVSTKTKWEEYNRLINLINNHFNKW